MAETSMDKSVQAHSGYALGYSEFEHERLIRQAQRINPYAERLFREAGIGVGHRVLDLGSGVGDVSLLLARIVGPTGEVVGLERDAHSVKRATARVAEAGLYNVRFSQADIKNISGEQPFDAAVGRFILMFIPDPLSILRSLTRVVRSGGIIAFQEPSWVPTLAFNAQFPLWSKVLYSIYQTFRLSGVNTEMGPDLFYLFQEAGLPAPSMHMETPMGSNSDAASIVCGVLLSLRPLAAMHDVPLDSLGDFETLQERVEAELTASHRIVSLLSLVGAYSRVPESQFR